MITKETPTRAITTKFTNMSSTSENYSSYSNSTTDPTAVAVGTTIALLFGLLATAIVVALLFLVYYKRKRLTLVNLTKPYKGSEENSYASSEHSHQQGSKYSESPEPGYDVIKPMHKAKIFPPKLKSILLDMNPTNPSEYASIENNNCASSSHNTTGSHVCSCEYSAQSTKDNPSINFDEEKPEICIVDSEVEKDNNKQKQLTKDAAKCNNNSTKDEISQISPQTIEMMYTEIQK